MSGSDTVVDKWFDKATFAKASTGHYMAWRADEPSRIAVLPPGHPKGEECEWLEGWSDKDGGIEGATRYVESGQYDEEEPMELNLWIQDPVTGEWH